MHTMCISHSGTYQVGASIVCLSSQDALHTINNIGQAKITADFFMILKSLYAIVYYNFDHRSIN